MKATHASALALLWIIGSVLGSPARAQDRESARVEAGSTDLLRLDPYLIVIGGLHYEWIINWYEDDERQDRSTTVAMSRVGLIAWMGEHLSLESVVELNAGPHGTSVWEGQAAISVKNQLIRLLYGGLRLEVGRVTDENSLDFTSAHIANLLLTDYNARYPLLVSGFNMGNGILARYELIEGLQVGFTVNAGNPTSTTGTVMIGGTYPPFARFYQVPEAQVGRDAHHYPTDSFQALIVSPSLSYQVRYLRAQAMFQYFIVDTNTNEMDDETLSGFNLRGGLQGLFLDGRLRPFVNASRVNNDMVDPGDLASLADIDYEARTVSLGVDFDFSGRTGVGGQYTWVGEREGPEGPVNDRHFLNLGASWWFSPWACLEGRYAMLMYCVDRECDQDERHHFYLSMRAELGGASQGNPGQ